MSLPQLIGLPCVSCLKEIASLSTAGFCEECGNPVHHQCRVGAVPALAGKCQKCGGDPDNGIAREVRRERGGAAQIAASRQGIVTYPVSTVCPECASEKFTRERPQGWVAFAWDRVCVDCGMRYSPPTPLWAAIVFIVLGVVLTGFGGLGLSAGDVCMALLGPLGILALIHGIRSLVRPGKV